MIQSFADKDTEALFVNSALFRMNPPIMPGEILLEEYLKPVVNPTECHGPRHRGKEIALKARRADEG